MAIKVVLPGDESAIGRQARWIAAQDFERVLDVGGLEKPLRAATHVMDLFSYDHRRVDEGRGSLPERFTRDTWITTDINETPWPFPDNHFDYVWCCQVVEDIRDPIAVCREMCRVGKAGFVSTVHRSYESSVVQHDGVVGYHHHRWLIELVSEDSPSENIVKFTWKSPILHVDPGARPDQPAQWLLHWTWREEFRAVEHFVGGDQGQRWDLEDYLERARRREMMQ